MDILIKASECIKNSDLIGANQLLDQYFKKNRWKWNDIDKDERQFFWQLVKIMDWDEGNLIYDNQRIS